MLQRAEAAHKTPTHLLTALPLPAPRVRQGAHARHPELLLRYRAFLQAELAAIEREIAIYPANQVGALQARFQLPPGFVGACPPPSRIVAVLSAARGHK